MATNSQLRTIKLRNHKTITQFKINSLIVSTGSHIDTRRLEQGAYHFLLIVLRIDKFKKLRVRNIDKWQMLWLLHQSILIQSIKELKYPYLSSKVTIKCTMWIIQQPGGIKTCLDSKCFLYKIIPRISVMVSQ